MMIKKKLAFVAATVALASVASPVFATTWAHRHHYAHRHVYNYRGNPGYQANASIGPAADPDGPALTGGGSPGYNKCAGHARGYGGC
jgi:hypothetical protein